MILLLALYWTNNVPWKQWYKNQENIMLRKLIYLLSCYESDLTLLTRFLPNKARLSCLEIFQRFTAFRNVWWYHEQALWDGGCWNWFQMGVGFSGLIPLFHTRLKGGKTKHWLWSQLRSLDNRGSSLSVNFFIIPGFYSCTSLWDLTEFSWEWPERRAGVW